MGRKENEKVSSDPVSLQGTGGLTRNAACRVPHMLSQHWTQSSKAALPQATLLSTGPNKAEVSYHSSVTIAEELVPRSRNKTLPTPPETPSYLTRPSKAPALLTSTITSGVSDFEPDLNGLTREAFPLNGSVQSLRVGCWWPAVLTAAQGSAACAHRRAFTPTTADRHVGLFLPTDTVRPGEPGGLRGPEWGCWTVSTHRPTVLPLATGTRPSAGAEREGRPLCVLTSHGRGSFSFWSL